MHSKKSFIWNKNLNFILAILIYGQDYYGCENCYVYYEGEELATSGVGKRSVFLAKLDEEGDLVDSRLFGRDQEVHLAGFDVDHENNPLLFIRNVEQTTIDGNALEAGYNVVKLDEQLNFIWSVNIKNSYHQFHTSDLAAFRETFEVTPENAIMVGGAAELQVDFNIILDTIIIPPADTTFVYYTYYDDLDIDGTIYPVDDKSMILTQIDKNGVVDWVRIFGVGGSLFLTSIAISQNKEVNVLGYYSRGDLVFDGITLEADTSGTGFTRSSFILKLNDEGEVVWANKYFNRLNTIDLVVDSKDNLIASGEYYLTTSFDQDELNSFGVGDLAIFKVDPQGNYLWGTSVGDETTNNHCYIHANSEDEIYISGNISASQGELLNKYSPDGELLWELNPPTNSNRSGQDLTFDFSGHLIHTGVFTGRFEIGNFVLDPQMGGGWQKMIMKYKNQTAIGPLVHTQELIESPAFDFATYPNPASEDLHVAYQLEEATNLNLLLFDALGRVVKSKAVSATAAGTVSLSLEGLSAGNYSLSIQGVGIFSVEKIVVIGE